MVWFLILGCRISSNVIFFSVPHVWKMPGKIKLFIADYLHNGDWHNNKNY